MLSPLDAEPRGRLDTGPGAVLVEAPAVPGAGEDDPVGVALGEATLGRDGLRGVDRVLVLHRLDDLRGVDEVLAAEGDDEPTAVRRHRQPHQAGHVVAHGDRAVDVRGAAQVVPGRPSAVVARQHALVGVQLRGVGGVGHRRQHLGLGGGRLGQHPEGLARVGGDHDRVVGVDPAVAVGHLHALGRLEHRGHLGAGAHVGETGGHLLDVLPRAAGDGAPLRRAEDLQHPVVLEEA